MNPISKGIRVGIAVFAGLLTIGLLGFTFMAGFTILIALAVYGALKSAWRRMTGYAQAKHDHVTVYNPDDSTNSS